MHREVGPPAGRDQYVCQQCAIIGYVALGPQAGEDRCCLRNVAGAVGGPGLSRAQERRRLDQLGDIRSEEHTSELQSLMRISYAVFCLKKKKAKIRIKNESK